MGYEIIFQICYLKRLVLIPEKQDILKIMEKGE